MIETWYVLADGRVADPNHVAPDAQGILRHQDGVAVALGPHGPSSRSVEVDVERAKATSDAEAERLKAQASAHGGRELQPAAGKPYRTRDLKAKD